jgi:hypothetical protein
VPLERFNWIPTRPPVVMDLWQGTPALRPGAAYTTIATWQNKGRDITYEGEPYYWSKDREFRKVIDLPLRAPAPIELAVRVDAETESLLTRNGWRLADPVDISRDVARYRAYVGESRGEFTVAKDQNVRLRSGWFSDRSACYLAAGRPVVTQDTGFGNQLPVGQGLFAFRAY